MKIAIVTGGSSGVGRSTVLQLTRQGYGVIFTFRTRAEEAQALAAETRDAVALPLDVADVATFDGFVARVRSTLHQRWKRDDFDVLVNNAGMGGGMPFTEVTDAYFERMFATNFKGPFFLTQKLVPLLREGGHIVNVSSRSTALTSAGYSVYGATKSALTTVTRYWAKELAPRKIRVNSISPGPILTNLGDSAFAKHPEYIAPLAASTLLGRIAQPDDVADVIVSLLGDSFRYVTGTDLDVSGGFQL
ncbi:MAG: SDR family oxidoreductase [Archangium sp.]